MDISKQKKDNTSREMDEQVFQASFNEAALGIAHLSPEGRFIRANKKLCDILGYEADELIGRTFEHITYPEDLQEDLLSFQKLIAGKTNTYTDEKRYVCKNGTLVWVSLTVNLIRPKSNIPNYIIGFVQDISERMLTHQKMTRQRILLEEAQHMARVGSWSWEAESDMVEWSTTLYDILGMDKSRPLPPYPEHEKFYTGDSWLKLNQHAEEAIQTGNSYSLALDMIRADGTICNTLTKGAAIKDDKGQIRRLFGTIQDVSERKQAMKALKDQEDSYKSLIEQAKDGIVLIQDEKVVYTNKALTDLCGYTKSDLKDRSFIEFLEEDQRERVKQIYEARMHKASAPSIYESALKHKDGQRLEVEINAGLSTLNGLPTDIVILRDINLRKKEQQKLEESEGRFRALYNHAGFALGMAKGDSSNHELVNQTWVDLFGYDDVSEVLGKSVLEFVAHEDRDLVRKYAKLRSEGKEAPSSYEIKGLRKDGTTFDMELKVSTYIHEDELHSIAMITDISERKKTQKERDRFFDLSSDLITISGFDGYFKHLNPAWEKVTGYKMDELLERPFSSIIHPDDREKTSEEVKKLSQGIPSIQFENRNITKKGEVRYFSWRATPLQEDQLIYSIARDVTESREAEEQIRNYQQRLKALSTELTLSEEKQRRQIAADLHDHVGQLMASSRLQLAAIHEDMEKKMILSRIKDVSKGLIAAIQATRNAIFDLSPPQLNEIGLFAAIADWLEEQVEIKHGIKTHLSGDDQLFPLIDDIRVLIFRCVRELLMNVVKHSVADEVWVEIKLVESSLNITIRDKGKGFVYNPHMLQLKSAGFGLFSIQERYSDMGGTVEIITAPGEGTTVCLSLAINDSKE